VPVAKPKFKILYVMSYHADWLWTQEQLDGFKYALKELDIEYKLFELDTKRNSSAAWKELAGAKARELIDTWQPDLVFVSDDDAQEYVTKYYINKDIPFVFSAVNADPSQYGFVGSKNITGVLERPHFAQSVQLLKRIKPEIKKIAAVFDDSAMWDSVIQTMKEEASRLPDIEIVSWDTIYTFEEYKQKIKEYQTTVDAIALIGIFGFKDEDRFNMPYQEVLKWTAENSHLPDLTFWDDRISYGTLCTVTVSGYEQGLAAGKIARGILVDKRSPASFAMEQTVKGAPYVSLARANQLSLNIDSEVLLTAKVIEKFKWDE
jgi:ABC-type uncharacterized transport system substrate-binding protein